MQAQTTKNMMALVRCLSPLRWFQCKELTITSYFNKFADDEKSNRNSAHCPSFVFVCADRRKKKKREPRFQLAQLHLFQQTHQQTIWIKLYQERQSQYIKRSLILNRMKHFYRYIFSLIFHCRYHVYWTL